MNALQRTCEAVLAVLFAAVIGMALADLFTGAATLADWFWGAK